MPTGEIHSLLVNRSFPLLSSLFKLSIMTVPSGVKFGPLSDFMEATKLPAEMNNFQSLLMWLWKTGPRVKGFKSHNQPSGTSVLSWNINKCPTVGATGELPSTKLNIWVVLSSHKNDIVKMPTVCLDQIKFLFTNSLNSAPLNADTAL